MGMTIIKNYGIPDNCYMCDLHNYHECDLTGESIEEDYCWNGDSREKHCPLREVETIPKADMVGILTDLKNELTDISWNIDMYDDDLDFECCYLNDIDNVIQQKINSLKVESEGA